MELTQDHATLRRDIRDWMAAHLTGRFAQLRFRANAGEGDILPELRKEWERELAAGGWTCPGWPTDWGGRAMSVAEQVVFQEEYAAAGGPGRIGHIGEGLMGPTLLAFGTDDQKARFLPDIRAGRSFWAQGYSEPSAGSDLGNIRTRARRDPDTGDWLVSGQKIWTSMAHVSDWIFVLARCEDGSVGPKGLIFLMMPLDQAGITIQPIRQIGGGAEFNSVFFDEARAKPCDVLGQAGEGWKIAMTLLSYERGISTLGQQMAFAREFADICQIARENGAAERPMIRQRLAQSWAGLKAMRYLAMRVLDEESGTEALRERLSYKYQWSNWHRDLGQLAMDVMALKGCDLTDGAGDERYERLRQMYLFSPADTIYGGTNEIQLNILAEQGLGMPKEPRGSLS